MSDDDELEFDVGAPIAAKPQSKPAKPQESAAASETVQTKKVAKPKESAAEASAPQAKAESAKPKESAAEVKVIAPQAKVESAKPKESAAEVKVIAPQAKAEVSKPKESAAEISISAPKSEAASQAVAVEPEEEFFIPNTFDNLEAWIRGGKRFKFWLRLKAVCLLPFSLVLIIFIIIYSVSLGGADKKIDRLMSEKEQMAAQLAQDSVKIDELSSSVEKLTAEVDRLRKANNRLNDRIKRLTPKPAAKPAANQQKKK